MPVDFRGGKTSKNMAMSESLTDRTEPERCWRGALWGEKPNAG